MVEIFSHGREQAAKDEPMTAHPENPLIFGLHLKWEFPMIKFMKKINQQEGK